MITLNELEAQFKHIVDNITTIDELTNITLEITKYFPAEVDQIIANKLIEIQSRNEARAETREYYANKRKNNGNLSRMDVV